MDGTLWVRLNNDYGSRVSGSQFDEAVCDGVLGLLAAEGGGGADGSKGGVELGGGVPEEVDE